MKRIAIIGSGLCGILLARQLGTKAEVVLFEKARGLGGRMSTRYADRFSFDHGAPFFTARTAEFQSFLTTYFQNKTIAPWVGEVIELGAEANKDKKPACWPEAHWVGIPNMNSLCSALAQGLTVHLNCEVAPLGEKTKKTWQLLDTHGTVLGDFDLVISTAPAPQTSKLFEAHLSTDLHLLHNCRMKPCYSLMLGFSSPWDKSWIAAQVHNNPIASIFVNSSKPGRDASMTCLVVHSTQVWAEAHMSEDKEQVQNLLVEEFSGVTGMNGSDADYISLHLWRYALLDEHVPKSSDYLDPKLALAATGDGCTGSSIEEVWIQAQKTAEAITCHML